MVNYAYLRVSTNQQDVDNQRHGILEYANQKGLGHLEFVEDSVSGQKKWRDRAVGELITKTAQSGDVIIFAEISRMARSTLQVLEILECCMQLERSRSYRQTTDGSRRSITQSHYCYSSRFSVPSSNEN